MEKLIKNKTSDANTPKAVNNTSEADLKKLEKRIDQKIEKSERMMFDNIDNT